MASQNTNVPAAPVMKLPTMYGQMSKTQSKAQTPSNTNKIDAKSNLQQPRKSSEEELVEIYKWACTLDLKEDVRKMPRAHRLTLLGGPHVDLICGGDVVGDMPLKLLLATSTVACKTFIDKEGEKMTQFGVSQPAVGGALRTLANYLVTVMKVYTHYKLPRTTLVDDIDLLLVADTCGMKLYVTNLYNYWYAVLSNEPISSLGFDNVKAIDDRVMTYTDHFNILSMFVKRFSKDSLYTTWRDKLPNIEAAVQRMETEQAGLHAQKAEGKCKEEEERRQEETEWKFKVAKEEFEENLRAARGGRPGGYGMGV
ncbi:hypothetical protein SLS60_006937 [Paraconiothyrium brasiliense]|uniref:Uncharacterized protein n=1 Tax=Paraconiothyrium brasiliense TaxID=300254 RepID=A0ABR3R802_9PLEO